MSPRHPGFRPVVCLMTLVALAAGCGGASGSNPDEVRTNIQQIESILSSASIILPSVPVDIGADGRVERIAGFPTRTVDDMVEQVTGNPLVGRVVVVDPSYLKWFDGAGLQHASFAVREEGVFAMVNARPLPSVVWDDASLDNLIRVIGLFQKDPDDPEKIAIISPDLFGSLQAGLPLLKSLNLQFDVRFPDYPDIGVPSREAIPLPTKDAFTLARAAAATVDEPAEQTVDVQVVYKPLVSGGQDLGWVPSLFGFSTVDLQRITESLPRERGKPAVKIPEMLMRDDIRRRLAGEHISDIAFTSRHDGLYASVQGRQLPHLAWNEESLTNVSVLLEQLYPATLKRLPRDAQWVPVVRSTAPMYNDYRLGIQVKFPVN